MPELKTLDRRSFLRGSALFAAAIGLSAGPAGAQQEQQPPPLPKEKEKDKEKEKPKDPFGEDEKAKDKDKSKKLVDKDGREYRICPQCGYNMYKEGRIWVCENCGYSYVE